LPGKKVLPEKIVIPEKIQKIVLKVGGSIITKKDTKDFPLSIEEIKRHADEYIRYDEMERIGKELKEALGEKNIQLILVNGVGPFGHFLVNHDRPDEEVRESVRLLNERFVSKLRSAGLDVVPLPPSESCEFKDGKFDISYLWDISEMLLEEGKVPSTYGDVLDSGKIISGDDLAALLAERWHADKIIMATDVDGIFTKNPALDKDAKIIKRIDANSGAEIKAEYTVDKVDVTGGMESKVEKMKSAVRFGIKCQIINGLKKGNIKAALLGDESIGTMITYRP
jgi:isopentenyl phosphate kinase